MGGAAQHHEGDVIRLECAVLERFQIAETGLDKCIGGQITFRGCHPRKPLRPVLSVGAIASFRHAVSVEKETDVFTMLCNRANSLSTSDTCLAVALVTRTL